MTEKDAEQYRGEWTSQTGRAPSDVYLPEALRETHEVFIKTARGRKIKLSVKGTRKSGPAGGHVVSGTVTAIEEVPRDPGFYGVPGTPSGDGDATGGGPYTPGSAIEEFGGEE